MTPEPPVIYRFADYELDSVRYELRCRGASVVLEPKVLDLLLALVRERERLVSKSELLARVWPGVHVSESVLTRAISLARAALGDSARAARMISTVSGRGYRFVAPVEEQRSQPTASPGTDGGRVMLAVLPFASLGDERSGEVFRNGLTEDIITQLARLDPRGLGVIARTSAMRFKSADRDIAEIAEALGVRYVLEGSARRAGRRVRITAQLIDARDQTHVWAGEYDREVHDVLGIQREVALAVAREIGVALAPTHARAAEAPAIAGEAYDCYVKGRFHWNKRLERGLRRAVGFFSRAIELEPRWAAPRSGLADAYLLLGERTLAPRAAMEMAKASAQRALALDPDSAEAHTSLARLRLTYEWDWRSAEQAFRRAIELSPSYVEAHHWLSHGLVAAGRMEEALEESERALEPDPLNLIMRAHHAWNYVMARRPEKALEICSVLSDMLPHLFGSKLFAGLALEQLGRHKEAVAHFRAAASRAEGSTERIAALAHAHARAGQRAQATRILAGLRKRAKRSYVCPVDVAIACTGLGDFDAALDQLEEAVAQRSSELIYVGVEPRFDPLRARARYRRIAQRVGFAA
jgi:TolB-like protein/Tfp pilus assembly protein PilF